MRTQTIHTVLLALFFCAAARADIVGNVDQDSALTPAAVLTGQVLPAGTLQPGIYRFTSKRDLVPDGAYFKGEYEINGDELAMETNPGEAVQVSPLPDGRIVMNFQLPQNEQGQIADQVVLSREEFNKMKMEFVADGGRDALAKYESGYENTQYASRGHAYRTKARRHHFHYTGMFRRDHNGRIAGGGGNCVRVVKALTGFRGTAGNGTGMALALLHTHRYQPAHGRHVRGMVCSWSGGWGGRGHVAYFDGHCFQPTYGGNCGSPGSGYHLKLCVVPRGA